jgi:hypothetical protein
MSVVTDDDLWLNASSAIFGRTDPDIRPLVELLHGDRPITPGIRHMLATMIDPDGDGYLHFKLKLESLANQRRGPQRDLESMKVAVQYRSERRAGKSSFDAALETAEKFGTDERTVYRHERRWKRVVDFLRCVRVRGADTK